jgi:ankyrin repeat protein
MTDLKHLEELEEVYCYSLENEYFHVAEILLKNGLDIHRRHDVDLRCYVENEEYDIVKFLLEHGANVHSKNEFSLYIACCNNNYHLVRLLLQYGADPNGRNRMGAVVNPLVKACENGNEMIVQELLQKGATIFPEALEEALEHASSGCFTSIVKMLLNYGANPIESCEEFIQVSPRKRWLI